MGEPFGRYSLERKLATGGMAEVFLAKQAGPERFERLCVIKRMLPELSDGAEFVQMFLDEARLAAQLSHPNIAQIYDFGSHDGTYFLAMEYVPGLPLHSIIEQHQRRRAYVPLALVARLVSQAASALDYAHNAVSQDGTPLRLIHRDVSPENMMLANSGVLKLIDFGIAKSATVGQRTRTGYIRGKFLYMSPEQVMGKKLDHRSDIFSLGLVLFELLTNNTPVPGDNQVKVMEAIALNRLRPITDFRPDVPEELRAILTKALQNNRDLRYSNAGEMAHDLERFILKNGTAVSASDLSRLVGGTSPSLPRPDPVPSPSPPMPAEQVTDPEAIPHRSTGGEDIYDKTLINSDPGPNGRGVSLTATQAAGVFPDGSGPDAVSEETPAVRRGNAAEQPAAPPRPSPPEPRTLRMPPDRRTPMAEPSRPGTRLPGWLPLAGAVTAALLLGLLVVWRAVSRSREHVDASQVIQTQQSQTVDPEPRSPSPAVTPAPEPASDEPEAAEADVDGEESAPPVSGPADATLAIRSTPATQVWIDGKPEGTTPLELHLASGDHKLLMRNDELNLRHRKRIHLDHGATVTEEWKPAKGTLNFDLRPSTEVFLNDHSLGVTPLAPVELWEGRYTVRLVNRLDHTTDTRKIQVKRNRQNVLAAEASSTGGSEEP